MKRQALGKGLSSLIPEPVLEKGDAGLLMLDIDRIQPNRQQPRSDFGGIEGLANSIRENGIIQPVVVRQEADGFRLIAGERRWRAAQMAGVHRIPAIVRKVSDNRVLELALIENIQRKELNPIEEAKAYEVLVGQMKLSQADLARRVGRDRSSISNSLRLLKLDEKIQEMIREGSLSAGHAKAIMAISDAETQIRVAIEVAKGLLSVRETEARVAEIVKRQAGAAANVDEAPGGSAAPDPNVAAAADRLRKALATRVRIVSKGNGGRIEITFHSGEELDRLFTILMCGAERGH
jgi:ParB family transcriptional regulator, chromosome partitioning protein